MEKTTTYCVNVFKESKTNSFNELLSVENVDFNIDRQLALVILNDILVKKGIEYHYSLIVGQWNIKSLKP